MRGRARGWLPGERMRRKRRRRSSRRGRRRRRPPPAEHGGIGPEGGGRAREGRAPTPGGGSPGHRGGRGRAGEGGPRPGLPVARPPPQAARAPERGPVSQGTHRQKPRPGASKPRSLRSGARAPLLLWPGEEKTERTGRRGIGRERAVTPLGAFCQRRREGGMAEQKKREIGRAHV